MEGDIEFADKKMPEILEKETLLKKFKYSDLLKCIIYYWIIFFAVELFVRRIPFRIESDFFVEFHMLSLKFSLMIPMIFMMALVSAGYLKNKRECVKLSKKDAIIFFVNWLSGQLFAFVVIFFVSLSFIMMFFPDIFIAILIIQLLFLLPLSLFYFYINSYKYFLIGAFLIPFIYLVLYLIIPFFSPIEECIPNNAINRECIVEKALKYNDAQLCELSHESIYCYDDLFKKSKNNKICDTVVGDENKTNCYRSF